MVARQDSELARLYFGNILFCEYLQTKRNPVFLHRNLERAHQLRREAAKQGQTAWRDPPILFEHLDRPFWKLPSNKAFAEMVESERAKESFILDIKGIKFLNADEMVETTESRPSKKREPLLRLPVNAYATVYAPELATPGGQERLKHCCKTYTYQNTTLVALQDDRGKRFSLNMADRFTLKPEDLYVPVEPPVDQDSWGEYGSWTKGMVEKYEMLISINFQGSLQAESFYKELGSSSPQETRLIAKWPNILQCPNQNQVVPFFVRDKDGKRTELDFGLEVFMRWATGADESLLATSNRQLRNSRSQQGPTPPQEPDSVHRRFQITYTYQNETIERNNLECVHCKRRNFLEVDDLGSHLRSCHTHFSYRIRKEKCIGNTEHWLFECDIAILQAEGRASARAPDPREISMVGPEYRARSEKTHKKAKPIPPNTLASTIRRKLPHEVRPRVRAEKKKYRVPKARLTYFRQNTKRPLEEGEYISESDDDVEQGWLDVLKETRTKNDPTIPEPAKRFLLGYDKHIREERLHSIVHTGDAIIRFALEKAEWLWEEHLFAEFKKKVDELLQDDMISAEVHAESLNIVKAKDPGKKPHQALSEKCTRTGVTPPWTPLSPSRSARDHRSPMSESPMTSGEPSTSTSTARRVNTHKSPRAGRSQLTDPMDDNVEDPDVERGNANPKKNTMHKADIGKGRAKFAFTGQITPQTTDSDGDVEMVDTSPTVCLPEQPQHSTPPYDECLCGEDAFIYDDKAKPIIFCESIECIRHAFHLECVIKHWKPKERLKANQSGWFCKDCLDSTNIEPGP